MTTPKSEHPGGPVAQRFASFKIRCVPVDAPAEQVADMRYAFYMGAQSMFEVTQQAGTLANSGDPDKALLAREMAKAMLRDLHVAVQEFAQHRLQQYNGRVSPGALPPDLAEQRRNFLAGLERLEKMRAGSRSDEDTIQIMLQLLALVAMGQSLEREAFSRDEWQELGGRVLNSAWHTGGTGKVQ